MVSFPGTTHWYFQPSPGVAHCSYWSARRAHARLLHLNDLCKSALTLLAERGEVGGRGVGGQPGSSFVKSAGVRRAEQTGGSLWWMTAAHDGTLTGEHQWFKRQRCFAVVVGVKSSLGTACGPHTALFRVVFKMCDAFDGHNKSANAQCRVFFCLFKL